MARKLNLNFGCRGNAGLDGRIQILFSRHEYSSPRGRLYYNKKPLNFQCEHEQASRGLMLNHSFGKTFTAVLNFTENIATNNH